MGVELAAVACEDFIAYPTDLWKLEPHFILVNFSEMLSKFLLETVTADLLVLYILYILRFVSGNWGR